MTSSPGFRGCESVASRPRFALLWSSVVVCCRPRMSLRTLRVSVRRLSRWLLSAMPKRCSSITLCITRWTFVRCSPSIRIKKLSFSLSPIVIRWSLGVPEPQTPTWKGPIDLMLVPGVVFDHHCHRIGRGGGYYDKFLRKHPGVKKFGICYAFQLKKHDIPHLFRDHNVHRVITPQQTIG